MVFKRKIYEKMLEWKALSNGQSALFIEGAKCVGKSMIAKEFAKKEYQDYMILDFANEEKEVLGNFENNLSDLDTFFRNLFLLKGKVLEERQSVIIFDDVHLFPLARQAIKYLVLDGRFDYIETGTENTNHILIPSEEYKLKMHPMDFEEFLWAKNDFNTINLIHDAFNKRQPLGEAIHQNIMLAFHTYMTIGGMPQVVYAFMEGKSIEEIELIKEKILFLYEEDLRKQNLKAFNIFTSIPKQLSSHFQLSKVDKNARYRTHAKAIHHLSNAMIVNECIQIPITDRNHFKLYMADTGLLVTQIMKNNNETGEDLYKALIFNKLSINQGMIMENMVAQMLRSQGYDLYFHEFQMDSSKQKYEIDFVIVKKRKIVPIEVKSSSYKRHKSFDLFTEKYPIKIEDKYVIYTKDLHVENGILYIPIYMTICL